MTKQITITILAEDILKNSYFGSDRCPITRALKRGGYDDLQDCGHITGELDGEHINIDTANNTDYKKMLNKLFSMYNTKAGSYKHGLGKPAEPMPIEDFTVTINF